MPSNELICPACSSHIKRPASVRDGEVFECPMCATEFRVGGGGGRGGRITTQRTARPQVEELEEIEEPVEELEVLDGERRRKKRKRRPSGVFEMGRWIRLGFLHWLPMLPPSVGFCIVYILGMMLVNLVIGLLLLIPGPGTILYIVGTTTVSVSWSSGMTLVAIQQLQGKRWRFGDFFAGSQWWMALFLNWLLLYLIYVILVFAPAFVIGYILRTVGIEPTLMEAAATVVGLFVYFLLYPLTWMFSWQLILDGNYGPLEAIIENFQMGLPQYFKLLGLAFVTLGIRFLGLMLCGVGFVAAWPLAVLIETTAYLRLTGQRVAEKASEIN